MIFPEIELSKKSDSFFYACFLSTYFFLKLKNVESDRYVGNVFLSLSNIIEKKFISCAAIKQQLKKEIVPFR
jgi:hypothetical protein